MAAPTLLASIAQTIDLRLEALLPPSTQEPEPLHEAMRYSCLAAGKRLRPALCVSACESVGGNAEAALDAGCALEIVHCFSLIHDDLPAIDDDALRRGVPTCHVKYGEGLALLAGDALFALAFEVMASIPAPAVRVVRALRSLARASGSDGLVGGEVMDVLSEGTQANESKLAFIHSRKTGALIASACEIGGLLGGGSDDDVEALRKFGAHVGLAFQIADDLLNELSTPEALGKAAGSDRLRGKATYPALHGIEEAKVQAEREVEEGLASLPAHLRTPALDALARYSIDRLH